MGLQRESTEKHITTCNTMGRTTVNPLLKIDVVNIIELNSDARV
jgi:hypothetical protein